MIYLYSSTILAFQKKVKHFAFNILATEVGVQINRKTFQWGDYHYPLKIVVFEDPKKLGFYDSFCYTVGINKTLMYKANDETLKNIIRHELAHYLVSIMYGEVSFHGRDFATVCRRYGWGREVAKAYSNTREDNKIHPNIGHEKLLEKIKKIFALASSSNSHESQAAAAKANELLLRYNLQNVHLEDDEEEACLKRVLTARKNNAKMASIYEILKTFYVRPVFNKGKGIVYLEIVGLRANVELGEYVAHFLDCELDRLWEQHQKKNPYLKGLTMKNSFFRGLAEGYTQKIKEANKKNLNRNEIMVIQNNLDKYVGMVYGRLSSTIGRGKINPYSQNLGKNVGKNLTIRQGIKGSREVKQLSY